MAMFSRPKNKAIPPKPCRECGERIGTVLIHAVSGGGDADGGAGTVAVR